MSWTTACLLINKSERGYFGGFPRHSRNRARSILNDKLGLSYAQSKLTNFDHALRPPAGWYGFGVYDEGLICSGYEDLFGWVENPRSELVTSLISQYKEAEALVFELGGGTGYFAFAYFLNGEIQRSMAGDPDRGIVIDSSIQNGTLNVFPAGFANSESRAIKGEGIVFQMTSRFFGVPLNKFAAEKLTMELIKKPGLVNRLVTRLRPHDRF